MIRWLDSDWVHLLYLIGAGGAVGLVAAVIRAGLWPMRYDDRKRP